MTARIRPVEERDVDAVVGLVHELATADELVAKAKAWVLADGSAQQPHDVKGYKVPGGTPSPPSSTASSSILKSSWPSFW